METSTMLHLFPGGVDPIDPARPEVNAAVHGH